MSLLAYILSNRHDVWNSCGELECPNMKRETHTFKRDLKTTGKSSAPQCDYWSCADLDLKCNGASQ